MANTNATDATVFDVLHRLFGAGDYNGAGEWHRWRMKEISKIKAYRSRRNVDPFELVATAQWCRRHRIWIKAHWELYEYIPAAQREEREREAEAAVSVLEADIQKAIEAEIARPDGTWLDRLVRAAGPARKEVYEAWKQKAWKQRSSDFPSLLATVGDAPPIGMTGARSGESG